MSPIERFTWIGPFTSASSAGDVARGFARGLAAGGHAIELFDSGDGSSECQGLDVDGPVRWADTTIVRQATLSTLGSTAAILAPDVEPASTQVAYVVADVDTLPQDARSVLDRCAEVWAPSLVQLELLRALGIPRSRLRVVAPGIDMDYPTVSARDETARPRVLVVGGSAPDGSAQFEASVARPGTPAFAAEVARADLVLVLSDVDPWGRVALEALRQARPLVHVESGIAAEHAGDEDCTWIDADLARDPRALAQLVETLLRGRGDLARRAARARERVAHDDNLAAAARRLVARRTEPRVLPEPRLARALTELGMPTPTERLAGSRPKVLIVPVAALEGPWRADLRRIVASTPAHVRSEDRATICLWVDESCSTQIGHIAAAAEAEIAAASGLAADGTLGADHDVLIVIAPLAHAPRERFLKLAPSAAPDLPIDPIFPAT